MPSNQKLFERRTAWTFIWALLWKNWLLKMRHPIASTSEVMVPAVFILLLSVMKGLTITVNVSSGWGDTDTSPSDDTIGTSYNLFQTTGQTIGWVDTDLPKFALHETSMTGILSLGLQSINDAIRLEELSTADQAACSTGVIASGLVDSNTSSTYRVPKACAEKVSPYKIAIAPDNTFTRKYLLKQWKKNVVPAHEFGKLVK
ncbi:unnamed protein product [Phytophthora lilii]|uniref:Unnamed protein product n=1 Tax=Phytophthora lilii TaxID=2077276 RepID=A0A9W6WLV2_9STRA|nr:unnamed protein product [Phytophthora lilii]